ncbi:MAG: heme-binding domain-containing protein [Ignavibacteriaceae bacterium]|nr:heme-binding domain-containing protein [Ignavibacterium sp.]MCC6256353.1 heme-binding domain-containing protein [Ignavibacteriaceae bacterium]HMN24734.1 heme-binding domain-containing protein [Ignavibacteriaceae bacterium]HRN27833.1 heme-binding domain-containing protein [Ignavibacteriaceae bacterium]HRP91845.1 heme-binding domain-containing protein [Ignavibacteriaceae bacterium]
MKKFIVFIVVVLIGIQFIPVERTNPPVPSEINAPANIKEIFKKACYDCHSNETNWAWYTKVAPASFLAVKDVEDGRKELNFSEWGNYTNKTKKIMDEIWEEVREEQMPPWQYRILHSESKLSQEEKDAIRTWAMSK